MSDKTVKKEIKELEEILDSIDDTNPDYVSPLLNKLTHRTIITNARLETAVDVLIMLNTTKAIKKEVDISKVVSINGTIRDILEMSRINLHDKVNFLVKTTKFPKGLASKIKGVNKLRNKFAHPRYRAQELKKFANDSSLRNVLNQLIKAREAMENYYATK